MSHVGKNKSLSVEDLPLKRSAHLRQKQALRDLETLTTENPPDKISSLDVGASMGFSGDPDTSNLLSCRDGS